MGLKEKILKLVLLCMPKKNMVLFNSFDGQYNDNPKYISEMLHRLDPSVEIVWVKSSKSKETFPEYVRCIELDSREFLECSFRSKVLVDNVIGYRWSAGETKLVMLKRLIFKSAHQLCISTWHGTPIKKIGRNSPNFTGKRYFASCSDYLIAGCQYTKKCLEEAFYPMRVEMTGTPRNDILVKGIDAAKEIQLREKLKIPFGKKIILFAPTFRNSVEFSGVHQLQIFDVDRILKIHEEKYGGEWVFVFRVHHTVLNKIDTERLTAGKENIIINGNVGDDMAEYLSMTDALITDYSGSIFDFAITGKPCYLYTPDQDHYINEERGTYISLYSMPYPHTDDVEQLYKIMEEYDVDNYREKAELFNKWVGNIESGEAANVIARRIVDFMRK